MRKVIKGLACFLMATITVFSAAACGGNDDDKTNGNNPDTEQGGNENGGNENEGGNEGGGEAGGDEYTPRAKQEMPVAQVVDTEYDYGNASSWAGEAYASQDLGYVYLQDVVDDCVYDWGHTVIKEDGKYKMWWVRPAVYDAIFYAESTDLKNWTNVQRVICLSPNAATKQDYNNIKGMLGKPSVIHVGDTYYMYFEAPATEDPDYTQEVLEWDNQVMLATSQDGISWEFYSDEAGQPKPVVAMDKALMGNFNSKEYGVGQPSVFYKDETFYLTYCYVIYSTGKHEIRYATSKDGKDFGDPATHKTFIDGTNGLGVTYNTKTNKYMVCSPSRILEGDSMDAFVDQNIITGGFEYYTYETATIQTSFGEFVKNAHGLVDTETFYTIHMQGDKSLTADWRGEHETWDTYIHAVNPREYANRTITLPNGGAATTENLKGYRNRANSYEMQTADAIYAADGVIKVDGEKEDIYNEATCIEIKRSVYTYGSNFTDTWGKAWVAWSEGYLYVFASIYDADINTTFVTPNPLDTYMKDSLDIFVDADNTHVGGNVSYDLTQYMICTGANNSDFCIKGSDDYNLTGEFTTKQHRVRRTDYGYCVELKVSWHELSVDYIEEDACIGLDFSINDCTSKGIGREAMVVWNDHTGNSFQYVDRFGDVYLIKK